MPVGPRGTKMLERLARLAAGSSKGNVAVRAVTLAIVAGRFLREERHRLPLRRDSLRRSVAAIRGGAAPASAMHAFIRETLGGHVDVTCFGATSIGELFPEIRGSHLLSDRERVLRLAYLYIERQRLPKEPGDLEHRYWMAYEAHLEACPSCQGDVIEAIRRGERRASGAVPPRGTNGGRNVIVTVRRRKRDDDN